MVFQNIGSENIILKPYFSYMTNVILNGSVVICVGTNVMTNGTCKGTIKGSMTEVMLKGSVVICVVTNMMTHGT